MSIPEPAKHFIHNPLNVPYSEVTHAMDVEVRDRQCNRIEMTLLLPNTDFYVSDINAVMEWSEDRKVRKASEQIASMLDDKDFELVKDVVEICVTMLGEGEDSVINR